MVGQMVYEKADQDSSKPFIWNASNSPAGIYFVKITGANINENFKIIKR